jgi:flavin-dependent dehydrogenase
MTTESENKIKKVIIISGGLAGLNLANSLQTQGIPFEVYEHDTDIDARAQGWSPTLHFALSTLKECVPKKAFQGFSQKACVTQGVDDRMSFAFVDGTSGSAFMKTETEPGTQYHIHRNRFRKWLLKQVQNKLQYNKKMTH